MADFVPEEVEAIDKAGAGAAFTRSRHAHTCGVRPASGTDCHHASALSWMASIAMEVVRRFGTG
jgi:hypothetical protein